MKRGNNLVASFSGTLVLTNQPAIHLPATGPKYGGLSRVSGWLVKSSILVSRFRLFWADCFG